MIIPNAIIHNDCLQAMKQIHSNSIDMILCDLPYGTTACKWDTIIPFEPLWEAYNRIIKDNGAILLTANQPFTTQLISSNIKNFKYCWYWNKINAGNFVKAKYKPMSVIEEVCVFSKNGGKTNYYPLMEKAEEKNKRPRSFNKTMRKDNAIGMASGVFTNSIDHNENLRFPKNVLVYNNKNADLNALNRLHPTQKPIAMLEYLINTYTKEKDIVLDNCMGSGSTVIACINTNRLYIGIEKDTNYFNIANNRINSHILDKQDSLFSL